MRVLVVQPGARRNYAIPRMLEARGHLYGLQSDFCLTPGEAGLLRPLVKCLPHSTQSAFERRIVHDVPKAKIGRSARFTAFQSMRAAFRLPRKRDREDEILAAACGRDFGAATHLYTMMGAALPLMKLARDAGVCVVTDVFVDPRAPRISLEEARAFPEWRQSGMSQAAVDEWDERVEHLVATSDALFCPSEHVAEGLRSYDGFRPASVRLVPFGVSVPLGSRSDPVIGRILVVGAVNLRKGSQYVAAAAKILATRMPEVEIRMLGIATDHIRTIATSTNLTFLGHVPKSTVREELSKADAFLLPSLAEGSAGSIFEALAVGLPIITTTAAGSVVTNGNEGLIIPTRSPVAIAEAIEQIVSDRNTRERMASASLATAHAFREDTWGDRLVMALGTVDSRVVQR